MIDLFRTWLPQIIGYAEKVEDGSIKEAWVEGNLARTSVDYSGELYEQVFGDLDSDIMLEKAREALSASITRGGSRTIPVYAQAAGRLDRGPCRHGRVGKGSNDPHECSTHS
jgi:hypothetical protein